MSFSRVEELPELIRQLNRIRSAERRAVVATEIVNILHALCDEAVDRRNRAALKLYDKGYSLETIGQLTGLSRARIHQIINEGAPTSRRPRPALGRS